MGTNYFCREKTRNLQERHIGKKSYGWTFIFHGHEKTEYGLKSNLKNYVEWKKYLLSKNVEVYEESGKKVNTSKFLVMIEASLSEGKHIVKNDENEWIDEEGFVFLNYWFC